MYCAVINSKVLLLHVLPNFKLHQYIKLAINMVDVTVKCINNHSVTVYYKAQKLMEYAAVDSLEHSTTKVKLHSLAINLMILQYFIRCRQARV